MKIVNKMGAAFLLSGLLAAVQGCASSVPKFDGRIDSMEQFPIDYECRIGPGAGLQTAEMLSEAFPEKSERKSKRVVVYSTRSRQIFGPWQNKAVGVNTTKVQEILERLSDHPSVSMLMAPKIHCFDGERASLSVSSAKSYVKEFKIEVAEEAMIGDPHIDVVRDGLLLVVQPKISKDGKLIHSRIIIEIVALKDMPALEVTLPLGRGCTVQTPVVLSQKLSTDFEWHDGGTVAMAGFFSEDRDSFLTLFMTANIVHADKIEAPTSGLVAAAPK